MSPHGLRLTVPLLDDGLQAIASALSEAPIFCGKKIELLLLYNPHIIFNFSRSSSHSRGNEVTHCAFSTQNTT